MRWLAEEMRLPGNARLETTVNPNARRDSSLPLFCSTVSARIKILRAYRIPSGDTGSCQARILQYGKRFDWNRIRKLSGVSFTCVNESKTLRLQLGRLGISLFSIKFRVHVHAPQVLPTNHSIIMVSFKNFNISEWEWFACTLHSSCAITVRTQLSISFRFIEALSINQNISKMDLRHRCVLTKLKINGQVNVVVRKKKKRMPREQVGLHAVSLQLYVLAAKKKWVEKWKSQKLFITFSAWRCRNIAMKGNSLFMLGRSISLPPILEPIRYLSKPQINELISLRIPRDTSLELYLLALLWVPLHLPALVSPVGMDMDCVRTIRAGSIVIFPVTINCEIKSQFNWRIEPILTQELQTKITLKQ